MGLKRQYESKMSVESVNTQIYTMSDLQKVSLVHNDPNTDEHKAILTHTAKEFQVGQLP